MDGALRVSRETPTTQGTGITTLKGNVLSMNAENGSAANKQIFGPHDLAGVDPKFVNAPKFFGKCDYWGKGAKESFTVSGVPEGAKFFAVRAFDDSSNRSAISNVYAR